MTETSQEVDPSPPDPSSNSSQPDLGRSTAPASSSGRDEEPAAIEHIEEGASTRPAEDEMDPSTDELTDLAEPAVYDATRAMVSAVLDRAAELLESGALGEAADAPEAAAAASQLLRRVLRAARQQVELAVATVHRLLPLGVRLCEEVMTVEEWRRVEQRSQTLARRLIYRAFGELSLTPLQRLARELLRRLRRRPPLLWARLSLAEAEEELSQRRPPLEYPGRRPDEDAAAEAETALLRAYRAAVRSQLTEPVPQLGPLLTIGEFVDDSCGLSVIHDVVRTWRYAVRWRYCVDYLRSEQEPLQAHHFYQVRFSIPEPHQPVPKAVAYVFFRLTVSKVHSIYSPIQVCYQTETSRLRHVPGKTIFQEKWLVDIVNAKLKLWREIQF